MKNLLLLIVVICSLVFAACSGSGSSEQSTTGSDGDATVGGDETSGTDDGAATGDSFDYTWHNSVSLILANRCVQCHTEGGIRSDTPLDDFDTAKGLAALIKEKITERTMPPYLAGFDCNEYSNDERLTEAQIAAISDWADNGAPEGQPKADQVVDVEPLLDYSMDRVDLELKLPTPYTPVSTPDDYRCFLMDWPETEVKYVTGWGVKVDNAKIVHHIIAYYVPPENVAAYEAFEAAESEPGYACYGGPAGKGASSADQRATWIGGWAPGGKAGKMPLNTGIKVKPGGKIALQMHYSMTQNEPSADQSSIVFQLEDSVEKPAFILPWTNFKWLGGDGMNIPAGESDVVHSFSNSPHMLFSFLGTVIDNPLTLHAVGLHMHVLGISGTVFVQRADGTTEECLLDQPHYDFNWQRNYVFKEPVLIYPGDKLGVECHWDNSLQNQLLVDGKPRTPRDVSWGDGTVDEMCLAVFYVTGADEAPF